MTFTPYKKLAAVLAAGSVAFTLAACGSDSESAADGETTQIRVGTSPGPYSELFRDGIDPILTEQGYDIDYTEFADLLRPMLHCLRVRLTSTLTSTPRT